MRLYADYPYYLNEYHGEKLGSDEFNSIVRSATEHVRRITFGRANLHADEEAVKLATCAVCEAIAEFNKSTINGRTVASENNDGYSVSFVADSKTPEEILYKKIYASAEAYLNDTGFLSWGCD